MKQLAGTYYDGKVHLDKVIPTDRPLKVLVVFEEADQPKPTKLNLSDFSFAESRAVLKDFKGSFSDAVAEERREAL